MHNLSNFSVDWCGCSPNDFKPDDWPRLQATEQKQLFFGRKFEPVINQLVILQLEEWLYGPYSPELENMNSYWQNTFHYKDKSPLPNEDLLTIANQLIQINSKTNAIQFYEPMRVLEITDYFVLDVYKGFLIKHEAKVSGNLTIVLETWASATHHHAQVSKSIKLAQKIMQLDVSSDLDQKELVSRNFARILGVNSEPVLVLKLAGTSQPENKTITLTVLWVDPEGSVVESSQLTIDDLTVTSLNFAKSNLPRPLVNGSWTVKILLKKSLIGQTKFLIIPSSAVGDSQTKLDELVSSFYLIKQTCISYNKQSVRTIVANYLSTSEASGKNSFLGFSECKKTQWSTMSPDPKSELEITIDGSSQQ